MGELIALCDRIFAGQPMLYWQRALEQAHNLIRRKRGEHVGLGA